MEERLILPTSPADRAAVIYAEGNEIKRSAFLAGMAFAMVWKAISYDAALILLQGGFKEGEKRAKPKPKKG